MDVEQVIYSLNIEDVLMVIEENDMDIELDESDISFIEDKVGEMIDWRSAIEYALSELENHKAKKISGNSRRTKR